MRKYKGSIALPTAVLIGSILLLGGLSIVMMSLDVKKATGGYNQYTQARLEAETCLEEAVYKVKFDADYTGTINLSFPDGSCSAVVSDIGPSTLKEIVITSDYNNSDLELKYEADVSDLPVQVTELQN